MAEPVCQRGRKVVTPGGYLGRVCCSYKGDCGRQPKIAYFTLKNHAQHRRLNRWRCSGEFVQEHNGVWVFNAPSGPEWWSE
jgi:hypothetical protein